MRLGLLGGTFNPIHNGHLAIARQTRDALALDRVLFIPTNDPPHKPNQSLAPAQDRYEMVKLAIGSDPLLAISDVELRRSGKSYSIDTVRQLQQEYGPQTQLYFLIGLDAFLDFTSWHEPATLLTLCSFIIISRPGLSFQALSALSCFHPSRAVTPGSGRRPQLQASGSHGHTLLDLPSITALRHLSLSDSLKVQAGPSHGKSVAALSGILYTSTSYLRQEDADRTNIEGHGPGHCAGHARQEGHRRPDPPRCETDLRRRLSGDGFCGSDRQARAIADHVDGVLSRTGPGRSASRARRRHSGC